MDKHEGVDKYSTICYSNRMSKNESAQEFGESQHPILTKAAAIGLLGVTALGVGYAANQAYEAVANIANIQPSGEQIYDSIVGPAHE
jgi:hypothetical protein